MPTSSSSSILLYGYVPTGQTPGLFKHLLRPVSFSLVVNDFGIKYVGKEHADHLLQCLDKEYPLTIDWEGKIFCGIHLKWDYDERTVELSMPNYVKNALTRFKHPPPRLPQHSPHKWTPPKYGQKQQFATSTDHPPLTPAQRKHVQEVVGVFLQEAETGAGFINAKDAVPIRTTLAELGHPQGPTPLQFDNKCATGIINDTVTQRRSKAMDMRFYWLRDRRRRQKQFHVARILATITPASITPPSITRKCDQSTF
jgi:hypothetical protein